MREVCSEWSDSHDANESTRLDESAPNEERSTFYLLLKAKTAPTITDNPVLTAHPNRCSLEFVDLYWTDANSRCAVWLFPQGWESTLEAPLRRAFSIAPGLTAYGGRGRGRARNADGAEGAFRR